jgi:hypothetical protein
MVETIALMGFLAMLKLNVYEGETEAGVSPHLQSGTGKIHPMDSTSNKVAQ